MGYGTYITRAGYELQARLFAEGGNFHITRVEVGSGICPSGADPSTFTGLIASRAVATSTTPCREGCEVSLTVEYRSDLNGGLEKPFQINEFGVFSIGAEGTEILLLYGDLSDYPETAVPQMYGGCVRRYPINVTIGPDVQVSMGYPAGAWATWEEMIDAITKAMNGLRAELKEEQAPTTWHHVFEAKDWKNGQIRIPKASHGMAVEQSSCMYTLRYRQADGRFTPTWGTMSCCVHWDTTTGDLVMESGSAFAGDILVLGRAA